MRAIALDFNNNDLEIKWDSEVRGNDCDVQGALVNIMTQKQTDGCYPNRGTDLFNRGLNGLLLNPIGAQHECNFASASTMRFGRNVGYSFEKIILRPRPVEGDHIKIDVSFQMPDQSVIGREIEIQNS